MPIPKGHRPPTPCGSLAALIDAGTIKPVIDRVFPFDAVSEAFAYLEAGRAKGKVVVQLVEP
ncbi:zinc-binding dehydrogenase [Agrobacterium tumefaciens]|uniref:zinc-binding dehydrogenase n=1 Tax=Agrobacterium tumefaciens TaxID=358 RepID=UPI00220E5E51|nr:zinc-binding dehydrogenase [Agrobacterium tumefaciens]UXS01339.1 zinc-binding dehydrogenase [Agrobacterium tumefaciens]